MTEERLPKQVIVIRKDLRMRRGKEIAQGAHASMKWLTSRVTVSHNALGAITPADFTDAEWAWLTGLFTKITCTVDSEEELQAIHDRAWELGIRAEMVTDAGRTEFGGVPTKTVVAIGPDWSDKVDEITGSLKLY